MEASNPVFELADKITATTVAERPPTRYLNQFPGEYRLRITRSEISKNGDWWAREFEVITGTNTTLTNGKASDVIDLFAKEPWKREMLARQSKKFVAAALKVEANSIGKRDLMNAAAGEASTIVGTEVTAKVVPEKNPQFYRVEYYPAN